MPGGLSGLSLSEMGISTVKKSANVIKKAGAGVVQQVAQQVTGQTPNQIPTSKPEPIFETDDSGNPLGFFKTAVTQVAGSSTNPLQQQQAPLKPDPQYFTDDWGNPVDLLGGAVKQVQGMGNTNKPTPAPQQQQGTFVMPKAPTAQPPSEVAPQQAGVFDRAAFEKQYLGSTSLPDTNAQAANASLEQELAKQKAEDQQKIEKLRKQLHQLYYDEFVKTVEGKDEKKEETVQEKLEREEQEKKEKEAKELEEKKKKEEVPMAVKGRQGAHEGLKKQG